MKCVDGIIHSYNIHIYIQSDAKDNEHKNNKKNYSLRSGNQTRQSTLNVTHNVLQLFRFKNMFLGATI